MRRIWLLILLLCGSSVFTLAQGRSQEGTIVRMRMAECLAAPRGFMAALSGSARQSSDELCPEYVLVSDKVVYVIVGKTSKALVPLAETTRFHFDRNELLIRVDDSNHETRFVIREMVLRAEWDRVHARMTGDDEETSSPRQRLDAGIAMRNTH